MSTVAEKLAERTGRCRRFAAALSLAMLLLVGARAGYAQEALPLLDDDFAYGKKLSAAGFEDLAVEIYERLGVRPGLTPKQKQDIGNLEVDAYRTLASRAPDLATRDRYLALADQKIQSMVKELGETSLTPQFRYQQAQVLQTQGRSFAKAVKEEGNAERKKTLIAQGVKKFDECTVMLDQVAKDTKAKIEALRIKDPVGSEEAVRPLNEVVIKAELQRAWTPYYKAQLYEATQDEYKTDLSQAVDRFGKFIENYEGDMSMLMARYGRGLSYELLGRPSDAQADFGKVVELIDTAGAIPEVQPLKARCTIKWAEVSAALGQYNEALAALDRMLKDNPALQSDATLAELALLTKGKVLGTRAAKLKEEGNAAEATKLYKQAVDALREVIQKNGPSAFEASGLIAKYVRDSGMGNLDPESRLALATAMFGEKKYKESIAELQKITAGAGEGVTPDVSFKARWMLAVALRNTGEFQQSVKEFDSILRLYGSQPKKELAKVALEHAWTLGAYAKANPDKPELDKAYVDALKRLADQYPDTEEGVDARYYHAESLRQRAGTAEKFEAIAKIYAEVPETSQFHGRAHYLEGLCYYNIYKVYSGNKDAKNPKAQEALKTAKEKLLAVFENLPPPKSGEDWHVEAARTLADIYMDLKQPKEALDVLDMVTKKYEELALGNPKMLATRLNVYVKMGQLQEASAVVDELAQKNADAEVLLRGYLTVGDAYLKEGDRLIKEGKLQEGVKQHETAGGFFAKALPYVGKDDLRIFDWLASKCFLVHDYETCIKAIDSVEKFYTDGGQKADTNLWRLRILKARCYEAMSHWPPEALALLKQLEAQYPQVASIKVLRAGVHESKKERQDALKLWDEVDAGVKPGSEDWFNAKYHRAKCYYELGQKDRGNEIIDGLKVLNPDMGGPQMKAKFEALRAEYNK